MLREALVFSLGAALALPGLASAQAAVGDVRAIVLAAHGGRFGAPGGMHAAPRFGPAVGLGRRAFHPFPGRRFPFFPHRFRPFVRFGLVVPFYAPYYPYNPYCDPASAYYYPPWCYY